MTIDASVILPGHRARYIRSAGAMLGAVFFFSVMDSMLKLLSAHYPPMQVAALRGMASLPLVCIYVIWRGATRSLLKVRWSLHFFRAVIGIAMLSLFSFALKTLPLADAYSIFFVAPMLITALSAPLLGEKVTAASWWAIGVGMIGVLVVLRPTGDGMLTWAGFAVLATAVGYAFSAITVRMLSRTDSSESMVFWLMFSLAFGAGLLALPNWVPILKADYPLIGALAIFGFIAQLLVTAAFKHGEASAIAPLEYTALAWGLGLDWALWHTFPDAYMLLGSAIIIASGVYLIRHQTVNVEAEHP
ncbi:MAG TPA: DMT family transporter [Burkholderiaceae bacterium]|jgi:drug/metabolite transporter (DMT)-like permease|nr:DMT family transporter [Burkholderiaceae bacterium]